MTGQCSLPALCAALLTLAASALPAMAADATYDHNGSVMRVSVDGAEVRITYQQPRDGLSRAGISRGTVLFEGRLEQPGYLSGMAWLFSRTCGNLDYYVHGDFALGEDFTLQGAAPVRDRQTCRIVDNSHDNANARLGFVALSRPQAETARLSAGDRACTAGGVNATLRTGPGMQFGTLADLSPDTCGVVVATAPREGWVGVEKGNQVGWLPVSGLRPER